MVDRKLVNAVLELDSNGIIFSNDQFKKIGHLYAVLLYAEALIEIFSHKFKSKGNIG